MVENLKREPVEINVLPKKAIEHNHSNANVLNCHPNIHKFR